MDRRWYERTTAELMKGLKVRTLVDMENGLGVAPRGTILVIKGKFKGLALLSERCPCCGCQFRIQRVSPRDVELVLDLIPSRKKGG